MSAPRPLPIAKCELCGALIRLRGPGPSMAPSAPIAGHKCNLTAVLRVAAQRRVRESYLRVCARLGVAPRS